MSHPISICIVYKAALGDQKTYDWLVEVIDANMKCGHFSLFGCEHEPPCQVATEAQLTALNDKVMEAVKQRRLLSKPRSSS